MTLFQRIGLNLGSLVLGVMIALGFFYAFYDSESLTADVLQKQQTQDSTPDIVFDREGGQMKVFLNKQIVVNESLNAEFTIGYDSDELSLTLDSFSSKFPISYIEKDDGAVVSLQVNQTLNVDDELFNLNFDGPENQILLLSVEFLIDGELEELAIGGVEEVEIQGDNDGLH